VAREYQSGNRLQAGEKTGGERASRRKIAADVPFWSPEVSGTHPHKPARRRPSLLGSSPLIPALLLLLIGVLLPSSPWFRHSVHTAFRFPVIQKFAALLRGPKKQALEPKVKVWAKKQTGFYYCRGDILFGTKQGRLMAQDEALTLGYRPVSGEYCTADKPTEVSRYSEPSRKTLETK
jgi:hypothetical protein